MDSTTTSQLPSVTDVQSSPEWVSDNRNDTVTGTPIGGAHATPDGGCSKHTSLRAKRRREEKERSRVSRACDRCKRKKIKCTGRCPCALCQRAGLPCEFTASYTRGRLPSVVVDETAMNASPQPKILTQEQSTTPKRPSFEAIAPSSQYQRIAASPAITQHNFETNTPTTITQDPRRYSPEPAQGQTDQQGHYVGSSSAFSFLLRIQRRLHQDSSSSLSRTSSIFTFGDAPLPEVDTTFFVLPPKADAQRLVERYFDFAAPTHRFLHRPTIEKLMEEFYDTQGDMKNKEDAPARTALLFVVFAQAQVYMPSGSTVLGDSARYFFAAEHQLSKERGAVRLASVQARLLQCVYLLTQSRVNHCWSLFGTTAHLAFALGLNRGRRCDSSGTVDFVELESRRRLFWCAYSLDKYLSAALGRPRTFRDEDIDQELPTIVNDNDLHPTYMNPLPAKSHSVMMAPVEHIKLTRIVSFVLRDLYSIRPPSLPHRISLSQKYTKDLQSWRHALSRFLNDTTNIDSHLLIPIYQRQRSVLNLAYYHAMLLIHRPFLLSNFASLTHIPCHPSINPDLNPEFDTSANIKACLEAAMSIVKVVDDVFTGSTLFRAFWFTQYYAFCAVVVLYIYRIQQHIIAPGVCEGYFAAGQKCQRQLESVSETDCLARRYCLVLEELRLEAVMQGSGVVKTAAKAAEHQQKQKPSSPSELQVPMEEMAQSEASPGLNGTFYGGNVPPTPESTIFNSSYPPSNDMMADLTSWGQFDSLVTAGIGIFDGGFQGDTSFGFGFGL